MSDGEDCRSRKRVSEHQLTKEDDIDTISAKESDGHWQKASDAEISKRRILRGKRSTGAVEETPKAEEKAEAGKEAAQPPAAAEKKEEPAAAENKAEEKPAAAAQGEKKEGAEAAKPAPIFSFGNLPTFGSVGTGAAPFKFDFGAAGKQTAPLFGLAGGAAGGNFTFAPAPAQEEGDDNPEAEVAAHEGTVKTQALSKDQLKTGEEDDEVLLEISPVKLYKLALASPEAKVKSWVERGRGSLRFSLNKQTNKARIVMRAEAILKVLLNMGLWKGMKIEEMSGGKAVLLTAAENEDGANVINSYSIRVATKDNAKQFVSKVQEQLEKLAC
eukprot:m51a1_g4122 hypothetical protein (329) ;mRNA; f:162519-163862